MTTAHQYISLWTAHRRSLYTRKNMNENRQKGNRVSSTNYSDAATLTELTSSSWRLNMISVYYYKLWHDSRNRHNPSQAVRNIKGRLYYDLNFDSNSFDMLWQFNTSSLSGLICIVISMHCVWKQAHPLKQNRNSSIRLCCDRFPMQNFQQTLPIISVGAVLWCVILLYFIEFSSVIMI